MQRFAILMCVALICFLPVAVISSYSFNGKSLGLPLLRKTVPPTHCDSSLQRNSVIEGVLWEAPRGGGSGGGKEVSAEEFRFSDDQRAVFARMRRTMLLLGTLGIFTSTIQFLKDLREFLRQSPNSSYITLISTPRFIQLFFSIIMPTAADISLARFQLLLSRVFAEIEFPTRNTEKNDIAALMKSLMIYEGYLSKKRLPAILKAVAIVVVLITTGLRFARNTFISQT